MQIWCLFTSIQQHIIGDSSQVHSTDCMLYIALYLAAKHLQPVVNVFTVTGSDSKNFIIGISFHCKIFSRFREIPSLAPTLVTVSALLSLLGRLPSTPWTVWTLDTGSATFGRSGPRSPIILLPCRNFDNGDTFNCVTMTSKITS